MLTRWRVRRPSPAMVVALMALFVALSGTAVAAGVVPLAKRALTADNAKKLGGKTGAQIVAAGAALPGPAASAAGLVSVQPGTFSLAAATSTNSPTGTFTVTCPAGSKAVSGGFSGQQDVASFDTAISADGATFSILLVNFDPAAASGNLYAVCVK
jgi:hypothetical protein